MFAPKKVFCVMVLFGAQMALAQNCFGPNSGFKVPFEVMQNGIPKLDSTGKFVSDVFYPATILNSSPAYIGDQRPVARSGMQFKYTSTIWANRCVNIGGVQNWECPNFAKTKGNYYSGAYKVMRNGVEREVRPIFTTYAKANACTRLQAEFLLGSPMSLLQSIATTHSLIIVPFADRATVFPRSVQDIRLPNGTNDTYFVNLCLLHQAPMGKSANMLTIDYEVQDSRPESSTTTVITQLATMAHNHGKKIYLYTNDLAHSMPFYNGISQNNLGTILDAVDYFGSDVGSGAGPDIYQVSGSDRQWSPVTSMWDNMRYISNNSTRSVNWQKIMPWINMYDLQPSEAHQLYDIIRQYKMYGVQIHRNLLTFGGSCSSPVNQTLRNLVGMASDQLPELCKISQPVCPNSSSVVGTFVDPVAKDATTCMKRASDYQDWCGITPGSGVETFASYISGGRRVSVTSVGKD